MFNKRKSKLPAKDAIVDNNSLEFLRAMRDAINRSMAVIEFELDGTICCANQNFLNAVGYSEAEIIGQKHRMFVSPRDAESSDYAAFWERLRRGEFFSGEFRRKNKAGEDIWIEATYNPILDSEGKPIRVVKFAADITQRKIEAALDRSRLAGIKQSQAMIEFELDGTIISANENFCATMGYSVEEIVGKKHSMFVSPEYGQSAEYKEFWRALGAGEHFSGEFPRVGAGGKDVWIHGSYNPMLDHRGQPSRVVKFALDVTEQKQLQMNVESVVDLVSASLSKIAHGDLNATIHDRFSGRLGGMVDDLNTTVDKLKSVTTTIRQSAESVSNAAREIAAGNIDLQQRTENQGSALMETSATMEEMTESVKSNAAHATDASDQAREASNRAQAGLSVAQRAVSAMKEISESSRQVTQIINVIDDLAFQTNLLALNAAVEAARAGEQGRGFAVVASEVRNLASRSASSASEIKQLIKDSADKVEGGAKLVDESGEALEDISQLINTVSDLVSRISMSSQEQSQGIANVNSAIAQMDAANQQNSALVEETSAVSEVAKTEAERLILQVDFFSGSDNSGDTFSAENFSPLRVA